jgi:16S rRNA processing protein RimM
LTSPSPRRRYTKRVKDTQGDPPSPPDTQSLDPETAVSIGRITSTHGIRGEVRVVPLTDFPERFDTGAHVWLDGAPHRVRRSRQQAKELIVSLEGIDDRDAAEAVRGKELMAPAPTPLDEGVFYQHDIVGLRAVTSQGEVLGRVAEVLSTGSNDVYVVQGDRGELLLPALDDVVREVDLASGRIVVDLLEGLEFTRAARPRTRRPSGEERRLAGEPRPSGEDERQGP